MWEKSVLHSNSGTIIGDKLLWCPFQKTGTPASDVFTPKVKPFIQHKFSLVITIPLKISFEKLATNQNCSCELSGRTKALNLRTSNAWRLRIFCFCCYTLLFSCYLQAQNMIYQVSFLVHIHLFILNLQVIKSRYKVSSKNTRKIHQIHFKQKCLYFTVTVVQHTFPDDFGITLVQFHSLNKNIQREEQGLNDTSVCIFILKG